MIRKVFLSIQVFLLVSTLVFGQNHGFKFGDVQLSELKMNKYSLDSSAAAVVLNEFGEAYFDEGFLIFEYHTKIKILTIDGLKLGNFEIPLRKRDSNKEEIYFIEAQTSNLIGDRTEKLLLNTKDVFYENTFKYANFAKFTLPKVMVGSVIEVKYTIKSPFILTFWPWEFQREIPKVYSEYWAKIQANYQYNISLRGPFKLAKEESSVEHDCYTFGTSKADCSLLKFAMKEVPAFKEEDYMTAKSNFIAAINFELKEIRYFDGRVDKVTKEWADVEDELMRHEDFGSQIKRAKNLAQDVLTGVVNTDSSEIYKAKKIYDWVRDNYAWNDEVRMYSEFGVKKAWESKVGNSADINFILLGFLQSAGLNANAVILSTRSNGTPASSLYPVLSDYNYVIVHVQIGDVFYLLDGNNKNMPFGMLPIYCLNGNGRLLAKKKSSFVDLTSKNGKQKKYSSFTLTLNESGTLSGNAQISYSDYEAVSRRKELMGLNESELLKNIQSEWKEIEIKNYKLENLDDKTKPLVEKFDVLIAADEDKPKRIYFNPFLVDKWKENPFKSEERYYPVDFGAALQQVVSLTIQVPNNYLIDDFPKSQSLALPAEGGRYLFAFNYSNNNVVLRSSLLLNKPIYASNEYHSLKELFARLVQIQQTDLVFIRKE